MRINIFSRQSFIFTKEKHVSKIIHNHSKRLFKQVSIINMKYFFFILLGAYFNYFKTFSKDFYINDSGAIETQIMETSDKKLRNIINNTNGVFTTNSKFNGTSKCIGSYFYEKKESDIEKTFLDMNDLCQYKSGKYEFYLHFTNKQFDTSKMMSVKIPIKSGTGPFKFLNGIMCNAAWVVFNNEGHLPSYLMKAKCEVSDEIFKKMEEGF